MELPALLRAGIEHLLEGEPQAELVVAAQRLSAHYRLAEPGRSRFDSELIGLAYIATRMPATYAAVRATLAALAEARPDFSPRSALDVGAGPGTALWALLDAWPELSETTLVEPSATISKIGQRLLSAAGQSEPRWLAADLETGLAGIGPCDIVVCAYVLAEIGADSRERVLARLWDATVDALVLVEPGTPTGWARIIEARASLLARGAHLVAPCPHSEACPLAPPDWCHFAQRIARSRLHRRIKGVELGFEDEKFSYLVASRKTSVAHGARVIARPRRGKGVVGLKLCCLDGSARNVVISRRDDAQFKRARRADWGGVLAEPAHDG